MIVEACQPCSLILKVLCAFAVWPQKDVKRPISSGSCLFVDPSLSHKKGCTSTTTYALAV